MWRRVGDPHFLLYISKGRVYIKSVGLFLWVENYNNLFCFISIEEMFVLFVTEYLVRP